MRERHGLSGARTGDDQQWPGFELAALRALTILGRKTLGFCARLTLRNNNAAKGSITRSTRRSPKSGCA